jgi:hypothetical protein
MLGVTLEIPLLPAALFCIQEKSYLPKIERIFQDFLKMQFQVDIAKEPGLSQQDIDDLLIGEDPEKPYDQDLKVVAKFASEAVADPAQLKAIIVTIPADLMEQLEKVATNLKFSNSIDMMTALFEDFLHIWYDPAP